MLVCRRGTRSLFGKSSAKTLVKKILLWFRLFYSLNIVKLVKQLHYIRRSFFSFTSLPAMSSLSAKCESIRGPSPKHFLSQCKFICFLKSPPIKERCFSSNLRYLLLYMKCRRLQCRNLTCICDFPTFYVNFSPYVYQFFTF